MSRLIKFRGVDAYGKYRYGDLWQRNDGTIIFDHDDNVWHRVHSDSVAQLIAVDKNGCEVYEGDKLKRYDELNYDFYLTADFRDYESIIEGILLKAEG